MPKNLIILVVLSALLFLVYVLRNIKYQKLTIRNGIIWLVLILGIIIVVFCYSFFFFFSNALGIENLSSMSFYIGFLFLIFVCFNITKTISVQNQKIIKLTQELGILKNEVKQYEAKQKRNSKNK